MKNMEGNNFRRVEKQDADYYLKLPLGEYANLPDDELERAAEAMGVTVERLLSMTSKAQQDKETEQEEIRSREVPTKSNLQMILEKIDLSPSIEPTEEERINAEKRENAAYNLIDQLSNTKMTWEQRRNLLKQITKNFIPSLRVRFVDTYNELRAEMSDKEAFQIAMLRFREAKANQQQNFREIGDAYSAVIDEMETRNWFSTVSDEYIEDPRKLDSEDFQMMNRIRQAAYRGFNGDRVTRDMRRNIPTGYMQKIPALIYEEAKKIGVSDVHRASEPSGPSEVYGGITPNAYSRQNRPRRSNDQLESY